VIYFVILLLYERLYWVIAEKGDAISLSNFLRIGMEKKKTRRDCDIDYLVKFYSLRPLCRREIKQLSWFAPPKLFDRLRIALVFISVPCVVVKPPSSPSSFFLVTVEHGQDGWKGRDKDTMAGKVNDVVPRRSPKAGSRFERRSLTFFRSPGSWLLCDLILYVPNDLEDLPSVAARLCRPPPFTLEIVHWES